jgi:hypothetical protein
MKPETTSAHLDIILMVSVYLAVQFQSCYKNYIRPLNLHFNQVYAHPLVLFDIRAK